MLQTLTGDTVDGYAGCPTIGPKTAEKILKDCTTTAQLWEATLAAFKKQKLSEEVALVQAQVARICRASDFDTTTRTVIPWMI
jgi:DNA polymerase-1